MNSPLISIEKQLRLKRLFLSCTLRIVYVFYQNYVTSKKLKHNRILRKQFK